MKWMPLFSGVTAIAMAVLTGCANTTTTKFYRNSNGALVIESPKNIHAQGIEFESPKGTKIKIASWDSHVNAAVVSAQGTRESGDVTATAAVVNAAVSAAVQGGKTATLVP